MEAMRIVADALKLIAQTDSDASVQEVRGNLKAIREAANQLEAYRQTAPSRFHRSPRQPHVVPLLSQLARPLMILCHVTRSYG